jgi:hypothetical protein
MKKIIITLMLSCISTSLLASDVDIETEKNGIYWAEYDYLKRNSLIYTVDTLTNSCFVSSLAGGGSTSSFTLIDCEKLATRKEWQGIITWLK